jgi:hypothetical protein
MTWFSPNGTSRFELSLVNVILAVVLGLTIFQAFGLVLGGPLGLDVHLGPVFIILPLGIASVLGVAIVKKMISNQPVTKKDIYAIVIVLVIALLFMFFLRDFVPEIFEEAFVELQSMVGL